MRANLRVRIPFDIVVTFSCEMLLTIRKPTLGADTGVCEEISLNLIDCTSGKQLYGIQGEYDSGLLGLFNHHSFARGFAKN